MDGVVHKIHVKSSYWNRCNNVCSLRAGITTPMSAFRLDSRHWHESHLRDVPRLGLRGRRPPRVVQREQGPLQLNHY